VVHRPFNPSFFSRRLLRPSLVFPSRETMIPCTCNLAFLPSLSRAARQTVVLTFVTCLWPQFRPSLDVSAPLTASFGFPALPFVRPVLPGPEAGHMPIPRPRAVLSGFSLGLSRFLSDLAGNPSSLGVCRDARWQTLLAPFAIRSSAFGRHAFLVVPPLCPRRCRRDGKLDVFWRRRRFCYFF